MGDYLSLQDMPVETVRTEQDIKAVIDDALHYGWHIQRPGDTDWYVPIGGLSKPHVLPPSVFDCGTWCARWERTSYKGEEVVVPHWIYDTDVRHNGNRNK